MSDFSFLNNRDNLIFALICFVILLILLAAAVFIIRAILKFFKSIFSKMPRNGGEGQADNLNVHVEELEESKKEREAVTAGEMPGKIVYTTVPVKKEEAQNKTETFKEKEAKDIAAGLDKLKSDTKEEGEKETLQSKMPSLKENKDGDDEHKKIEIPKVKKFMPSSDARIIEAEKPDVGKQNTPEAQKDKAEKSIEAGLSKLKINSFDNRGALESKMPSRTSDTEGDSHKKIEIPRVKKFNASEPNEGGKVLQKPDFLEDKLSPHSNNQIKGEDQTIFEGGKDISRLKLEHKLRLDPKVWKAERQVGLTLSPVERAKLVKSVFSPVYGRDISKNDLRLSLKKLNQKMLTVKDASEHAKLRKEIKFFKKIGGIK